MNTHHDLAKNIKVFRVEELYAAAALPKRLLAEDCLALTEGSILSLFETPSSMDAYLIGICTAGEAQISINLHEYTLTPNTFFTLAPGHLFQWLHAEHFQASLILVTASYFSRIHIDTKQLMPLSVEVGRPCLALDAGDARMMCNGIEVLAHELSVAPTAFTPDLIASIVASAFYKVGDVIHRQLQLSANREGTTPRSEKYFKQFIRLLSTHYIRERTVNFYANELRITSKYLTTLIKRVSGRSVSEWIDNYVIVEAKLMLKFSDRSIQEIASELNFANQSFFGSYFRRNTGMSPSQYRARG